MKSLHLNIILMKANKSIRIVRKQNKIPPCHTLLMIYCSFVKSDLDYGDVYMIIQKMNLSVVRLKESLAITEAIRGTSQERLYQELGLESVKTKKKIFKAHVPFLQTDDNSKTIISFQSATYNPREWNELNFDIHNSTSYQQFFPPNFASSIM